MIELLHGDCMEILKERDTIFDVATTSPPYNLGINYGDGKDADSMPREAYLAWTQLWLEHVKLRLAENGSLFLNMGGKPTDPLGPFQVLMIAVKVGFVLQNTLYWIKSVSENNEPCEGHVKPLNSPRFVNDAVEPVFHLTKTGKVPIDRLAVGVPYADESNLTRGTRGKNGNLRCRGNALMIPYKTIKSRDKDRPHPATFPVELPEYCMKLHGLSRIQRTLDPFSGLGSSARAARRLKLNHLGIELREHNHQEAVALLEKD